jgi:hypothetical protein
MCGKLNGKFQQLVHVIIVSTSTTVKNHQAITGKPQALKP